MKYGAYNWLRQVLSWEAENGTWAKRKKALPKYEKYLPADDIADILTSSAEQGATDVRIQSTNSSDNSKASERGRGNSTSKFF